jgi:hypothetical protein
MSSEVNELLFPFMAHGHRIPLLDMAKLFDSRGPKTITVNVITQFLTIFILIIIVILFIKNNKK